MTMSATTGCSHSVCPWWLGWALASPVRRWIEDPAALLGPWVAPGSRVLEVGPGMGFFTIPLAERVGPTGKVVCVDLQPRMLAGLTRRLRRRGLGDRVEIRGGEPTELGIEDLHESFDFAVLIHVLHEVPDPGATLAQMAAALRAGGRLLLVEPRGHCSDSQFAAELAAAAEAGLSLDPASPEHFGRKQRALLRRSGLPERG